jgi:hypothetical protein
MAVRHKTSVFTAPRGRAVALLPHDRVQGGSLSVHKAMMVPCLRLLAYETTAVYIRLAAVRRSRLAR